MEMLIINIKYIAANELNSLISLIRHELAASSDNSYPNIKHMKVHRIITTIEVENDNSITSIELINLHPANADILLAITDITTNGSAKDIEQIYKVIDDYRLVIRDKLKSIARSINDGLDDYECGIFGRDYNDSECNYETKAD